MIYWIRKSRSTDRIVLQKKFDLKNINSSIDIIDFSLDNNYFMFKDYSNASTIINLIDFQKVDKEAEKSIQWMEDGDIYFSLSKILSKFYSESNKILAYKNFDQNRFFVADSLGSIRIFECSRAY